ncbi:MAG: hypothetical protein K6E21_04650 [Bacilli bacterium]|nr:hypothetical protein [Bacilli bacterium]
MKKKRMFGLVVGLLSLGLTGCLGGGSTTVESDGDESESVIGNTEGHFKVDSQGNRIGAIEPHTLVDSEGDLYHKPVEPTCTTVGKSFQQCTICNKFIDKIVPALGHSYVPINSEGGGNPCTSLGTLECSRCGATTQADKPLGHQLTTEATSVASITKELCKRDGCGQVSYILDCAKTDSGWNGSTGTGNTAYKMGSRSTEENATWNVNGVIPDGKYAIEIECEMTSSSHDGRYFFNHTIRGVADPASSDSDKDGSSEAPYRYQFGLNGSTTYVNPDNEKTYGENGMTADEFKYVRVVDSCDISGLTSFTLHHGKIGYSLKIQNVKLVKID